MKKIIAITLLFLSVMSLKAQEGRTLFNSKGLHGVYAGFNLGHGESNDNNYSSGSFTLAYVSNKKFEIGFRAVAFVDNSFDSTYDYYQEFTGGAYTGLHFSRIYFADKVVHFSTPVLLGVGLIGHDNGNDWNNNGPDYIESYFIAEPGINLEVNLFKFMKLNAGVSYRFTSDFSSSSLSQSNFNGLGVNIGLKIGAFAFGKKKK